MATETMPALDLERVRARLEAASPQDVLGWAADAFGDRLTMATAFGPEGCVLLDMLSRIDRPIRVFNLDTGYQFPETLALRDRIAERYGIEVELVRPEATVAEYEAAHGGPVYAHDPDRCCQARKLVPLRQAIVGYDAWISAIRAEQSTHRAKTERIGVDKFGLYKINPLLHWTRRDVWAYIVTHDVPYNPLHDQGYPSIGCWPCTKAVGDGVEDERAGRWAGQAKTECGLHSLDSSQL